MRRHRLLRRDGPPLHDHRSSPVSCRPRSGTSGVGGLLLSGLEDDALLRRSNLHRQSCVNRWPLFLRSGWNLVVGCFFDVAARLTTMG
jgi:hypothetical protein